MYVIFRFPAGSSWVSVILNDPYFYLNLITYWPTQTVDPILVGQNILYLFLYFATLILAGETENRCLKARISELEQEVEKHTKRAECAEDNSATTKNTLVQSEAKAASLKDQMERLESKLKSSENLQRHLETELSRLSGENDRVKGDLAKTDDELNCEKSKNTLLSSEVKQLGEKYKADIKLNQDQVKNLVAEVEEARKKHSAEISKLTQTCAYDVKTLQVIFQLFLRCTGAFLSNAKTWKISQSAPAI